MPKQRLTGPGEWRVRKLREQRAWCLLRAGERDQALAEFDAALAMYERLPAREKLWPVDELVDAARGEFRAVFYARLLALAQRHSDGYLERRLLDAPAD